MISLCLSHSSFFVAGCLRMAKIEFCDPLYDSVDRIACVLFSPFVAIYQSAKPPVYVYTLL